MKKYKFLPGDLVMYKTPSVNILSFGIIIQVEFEHATRLQFRDIGDPNENETEVARIFWTTPPYRNSQLGKFYVSYLDKVY